MIVLNGAFALGILFSLQSVKTANPAVPPNDPFIAAAQVPALRETVRDVHPRLIVTADTLSARRAFYNSTNAADYRSSFLSYLPGCYTVPSTPKFLTDATEGQVQGLWRIPTVAYHYLMTGDTNSFNAVVAHMEWLMGFPNWETTGELDCGMSAGNILTGAALAFDWLYNDLDPVFRERFRAKLWYQARAMYYAGHLRGVGTSSSHYWQNDPQNNHRWHRDAGLSLAVLAAYNGQDAQGWLLKKTLEELQFVANWLPTDGTSHESASYLCFGGAHLTLALQAADDCLGTQFLQYDFFANTPRFVFSSFSPELPDILPYGDTGGSIANYVHYLWKAVSEHQLADEQAAMERLMPTLVSWCNSFAWMSLVWHDTGLVSGSATNLPPNSFWPDMGIAYTRTGWATNAAAAMFKCGPLGGYKLNEFRNTNSFVYINVAHDDPDANSFVLFADGELLAETDRYSFAKRSANYNTVLINDIGQMVPGRVEPQTYSQPGSGDMTQMAKITAWRDTGDIVAVEGEASGSYLAYSNKTTHAWRPALSRFRRTFVWAKDRYVLVLDDIRSTKPADITWLMQSGDVEIRDAGSGLYRLRKGAAACEFQVVSDSPFSGTVTNSPADNKYTLLGWKQLRAVAPAATAVRFVSVYDLWSRGSMSVALTPSGTDQWTVTVNGTGVNDIWTWQAPSGGLAPSILSAAHQGEESPFFILDAANSAPPLP